MWKGWALYTPFPYNKNDDWWLYLLNWQNNYGWFLVGAHKTSVDLAGIETQVESKV